MTQMSFKILFFLATACYTWHPTGHFITARIAELEILRLKPDLHPKLIKILEVLGKFTKEAAHPFVECACFPDDIKYLSWKAFNQWHFYDYYIAGPGISRDEINKLPKSVVNLASSIADAKETLRNTKSSKVDDKLGKSFELRYLIHLIGDVHQPLHAASYVTKEHPKGNAGGNAFKLEEPKTDLHTYWDRTLQWFDDVTAPLEEKGWKKIETYSKELMEENPRSKFDEELKKDKTGDWILESKKICEKVVYNGVTEGGKITQEYRLKAKDLIRRQLTLGGYRLADTIIKTFSNEEVFKTVQNKKNGQDSSDDAVVDDSNDLTGKRTGSDESASDNDKTSSDDESTKVSKDKGTSDKSVDPKKTEKKTPAKKVDPKVENDKGNKKVVPKKADKTTKDDLIKDKKKNPLKGKRRFKHDPDFSIDEDELSEYEHQTDGDQPEERDNEEVDDDEIEENHPGVLRRFFSSIGHFFGGFWPW